MNLDLNDDGIYVGSNKKNFLRQKAKYFNEKIKNAEVTKMVMRP